MTESSDREAERPTVDDPAASDDAEVIQDLDVTDDAAEVRGGRCASPAKGATLATQTL